MIRCLDIHTHHIAPQPEGVIAVSPESFFPMDGQLYSLGIHPWDTLKEPTPTEWEKFERIAGQPEIVAVGECGIDKIKGGPLFLQLLVMKKQIEISEKLQKPLIIHDVKSHDIIVGLKRNLKPTQKWLIHGFRGKPTVARMMTDAGIYLSFGEKFNPETLKTVSQDKMLAETDESKLSIEEIIENINMVLETDIKERIYENTSEFLGLRK